MIQRFFPHCWLASGHFGSSRGLPADVFFSGPNNVINNKVNNAVITEQAFAVLIYCAFIHAFSCCCFFLSLCCVIYYVQVDELAIEQIHQYLFDINLLID